MRMNVIEDFIKMNLSILCRCIFNGRFLETSNIAYDAWKIYLKNYFVEIHQNDKR